ncbi:hypothetical protein KG091_07895 [Carnobacteriaceae bacterium zg-ZUI78]|nr:hypothetical protein [Carnobacteriaceae bacterium zg-ZUI78]
MKDTSMLILKELQSINKKLEVIASNFELKDKTIKIVRTANGKRIKKTIKRDLDYLG